jgi:hypothetical protein
LLSTPNHIFWPADSTFHQNTDDFPYPSTTPEISVFAADSTTLSRIEALFVSPNPKRVHVASGASIRHKVSLREPPSLAVWHDLWSSIVMPGILDDLPAGWPVAAVVEWRPGTLVYVSKTNNSLLLKGEAGGSGDNEPHVFLFQFNALDVTIDTKAAKNGSKWTKLCSWHCGKRVASLGRTFVARIQRHACAASRRHQSHDTSDTVRRRFDVRSKCESGRSENLVERAIQCGFV